MILCSHFLWFCDVETDVTNRDLTPNHSLVGGSSTSHCATPVLVNLQKIQGEEMSPFNSPCTAQTSPAQTPWVVFQVCSLPAEHSSCSLRQVPALRTRICTGACQCLAPDCRNKAGCRWTAGHHNSDLAPELRQSRFLSLCCPVKNKKHTSHPLSNCWFNKTMSRENNPFYWFTLSEQSCKSQ